VRGGSHGCIKVSAMSEILMEKFLDSHKTLFSDAHTGCLCIGCVYTWDGCVQGECTCGMTMYRECGVDKLMDIFV
jgi:hypothetical protein